MTTDIRTPSGVPAGGEFATHSRTDADIVLTAPCDRRIRFHPAFYETAYRTTFDPTGTSPIEWLDYTINGETRLVEADIINNFAIADIAPDGVGADEWTKLVSRKSIAAKSFFAETYSADFSHTPNVPGAASVKFRIPEFSVEKDITPAKLAQSGTEQTKVADFDNELNTGVLSLKLAEHLDTYFAVDVNDVISSRDLTPSDVRNQVKGRVGYSEIDDAIAVAGADHLATSLGRDEIPIIAELGRVGVFRQADLSDEIGRVWRTLGGQDSEFVNMLGTWALAKNR
jgi:hypothetical protein